jgi:hypothetical protein
MSGPSGSSGNLNIGTVAIVADHAYTPSVIRSRQFRGPIVLARQRNSGFDNYFYSRRPATALKTAQAGITP